ncbi:MAG: RNA polymerase sigma factor [Acidimicrobiia bacterium]
MDKFDITRVDAARAGDRIALNDVLTQYSPRAFAICRRVLCNSEDARDAAQHALIAIAQHITEFDGHAAFTTWAYRITVNAALDEVRRRNRRPEPHETIDPSPSPDPTNAVDDRLLLDKALSALLPEFRAVLVLRDLLGLDYAEIAEVLDVPPGTVRSRIARGRAQLAAALGNQLDAPERPTETT